MTKSLREQIIARVDAADTYSQHLSEERQKVNQDRETCTRLAQDASAARKSAEILALVRIGDSLSKLLEHLTRPTVVVHR